MKKSKIRKKYYMIVSNKKNLGVFPFSKEGREDAETYMARLKKKSKSKFEIKEH